MSNSADRRMRGARNVLVDLLGIGEALPLRDLPVTAAPPIVPFGGAATVTIEDTEPGVEYRLRGQAGAALAPALAVNGTGDGGTLRLEVPKINEPVTFTVEAARASGRAALLLGSAPVAIGLDSSIPAVVAGFETSPVLIDFGASVTVMLPHSQEAVAYRLVARPPGDSAGDNDLAALETDVALTDGADVRGTGGPIALRSRALTEDGIVRVRLVKTFPGRRETQVSLLTAALPIHVRADRERPVAVAPAVGDYQGAPTLTVGGAQSGVRYALHLAAIADADFDRAEPPGPAALSVATDAGTVRVRPPTLPTLFEPLPGYTPTGEPKEGTGADLALPMPPLARDTIAVVAATKQHGTGEAGFVSVVPLALAAVALVRPSPSPDLRIEASIADGKLIRLRAFGGEPGVFYTISAGGKVLGELYMHQRAVADQSRNKGLDLLAVGIDFVIAADSTNAAPPPVPRLDVTARKLPVMLDVAARRAMTGLVQALAAKIAVSAPPDIAIEFDPVTPPAPARASRAVAPRAETPVQPEISATPAEPAEPVETVEPSAPAPRTAKVTLASADANVRHVLVVDDAPFGDPVAGSDGPLVLTTGPLRADATLELLLLDPPADGVSIERRVAVPLPGS